MGERLATSSHDAGEGLNSAAIAILIMIFLALALWGAWFISAESERPTPPDTELPAR